MKIPYFQVNSFTRELTGGNPAGVCLLEHWLPDHRLQAIAASHLLSETAFIVNGESRLRWFTPRVEVDLCGHATLAAAHVLFRHRRFDGALTFETRGGELAVRRAGDALEMDFPAVAAREARTIAGVASALRAHPVDVYDGPSLLVVLRDERAVRELDPDIRAVSNAHGHGVIVTARGDEADFVSRYFAPNVGVPEDPVTGSAHCMLAPFWAERLGRDKLSARQVSPRGGEIECEVNGDRVLLRGHAVTFIEGDINV